MRNSANLSQAHVDASASFSIWAYRCSVSLRALEAYATGFHSVSVCRWRRTAPIPYEEESVETSVSALGVIQCKPWGCRQFCFDVIEGLLLLRPPSPHTGLSQQVSEWSCSFSQVRQELPQVVCHPQQASHLADVTGAGMAFTALTLSGSALTPDASMTCPRNFILFLETHTCH